MSDFHFTEAETLLIANALRHYIASGLMVTEDEALAAELLDELNIK
jgi:hypothetical protein